MPVGYGQAAVCRGISVRHLVLQHRVGNLLSACVFVHTCEGIDPSVALGGRDVCGCHGLSVGQQAQLHRVRPDAVLVVVVLPDLFHRHVHPLGLVHVDEGCSPVFRIHCGAAEPVAFRLLRLGPCVDDFLPRRKLRQSGYRPAPLVRVILRCVRGGQGYLLAVQCHRQALRPFAVLVVVVLPDLDHPDIGDYFNGNPDIGVLCLRAVLDVFINDVVQSFAGVVSIVARDHLMVLDACPPEGEGHRGIPCGGQGVEFPCHPAADGQVLLRYLLRHLDAMDVKLKQFIHILLNVLRQLCVIRNGAVLIVGNGQSGGLTLHRGARDSEEALMLVHQFVAAEASGQGQPLVCRQGDGESALHVLQGNSAKALLQFFQGQSVGLRLVFLVAHHLVEHALYVQGGGIVQFRTLVRFIDLGVLRGEGVPRRRVMHLQVSGQFRFRRDRYRQLDLLVHRFAQNRVLAVRFQFQARRGFRYI